MLRVTACDAVCSIEDNLDDLDVQDGKTLPFLVRRLGQASLFEIHLIDKLRRFFSLLLTLFVLHQKEKSGFISQHLVHQLHQLFGSWLIFVLDFEVQLRLHALQQLQTLSPARRLL